MLYVAGEYNAFEQDSKVPSPDGGKTRTYPGCNRLSDGAADKDKGANPASVSQPRAPTDARMVAARAGRTRGYWHAGLIMIMMTIPNVTARRFVYINGKSVPPSMNGYYEEKPGNDPRLSPSRWEHTRAVITKKGNEWHFSRRSDGRIFYIGTGTNPWNFECRLNLDNKVSEVIPVDGCEWRKGKDFHHLSARAIPERMPEVVLVGEKLPTNPSGLKKLRDILDEMASSGSRLNPNPEGTEQTTSVHVTTQEDEKEEAVIVSSVRYEKGDRVEILYSDGKWYKGHITKTYHESNEYDVKYDDGYKCTYKPANKIRPIVEELAMTAFEIAKHQLPADCTSKELEQVKAFYGKQGKDVLKGFIRKHWSEERRRLLRLVSETDRPNRLS